MTAHVPGAALLARLDRIKKLTDELARVQQDSHTTYDLLDRIRRELDAAREAMKPLDSR
jgi:hypothetical protein